MSEAIEVLIRQQAIDKVNDAIKKVSELDAAIIKLSQGASGVSTKLPTIPSQAVSTQKEYSKWISETNAANKEAQRLQNSLATSQAKLNSIQSQASKNLAANRVETTLLNKQLKEEAILNSTLAGAYDKLNVRRTQAANKLRDLISNQKSSTAEIKKAQTAFDRLDARVKKANGAIGNFSNNVGNYRSGLRGLTRSLRTLAGAFGFTGGIFLFASAIRNSFNRIREFDSSMQNLSGILQTTRPKIASIEKEVIAVAGASIKTSREVAELAEILATLGKRGSELEALIKPSNDLSIALQATSEDAAAFLVQTLNSFDETSGSAEEYAATITAIRTSTSLDFQKMRDSFAFISPIAKILNQDLADVGGLIGTLVDRGQKAESSGRLLATALQKLAAEGNTLESALTEINEAQAQGVKEYDLLSIATGLFGKQAAKIGIILASNRGLTDNLTKSIRENKTALDDLTGEQLESVDSKIKILDSSFERFVLTVDSGNGSISRFVKQASENLTILIDNMTEAERAKSRLFELTGQEDTGQSFFGLVRRFNPEFDELLEKQKEFNGFLDRLGANPNIRILNREYEQLNQELDTNTDMTLQQRQVYRAQVKEVESMILAIKQSRSGLQEQALSIIDTTGRFEEYRIRIQSMTNGALTEFIRKNKDATKSIDKIGEAFAGADSLNALDQNLKDLRDRFREVDTNSPEFFELQKEISQLEARIASLTGKSKKLTEQIIGGTIKAYQEEIASLEKLRDGTSKTTEEYKAFEDQIGAVERKISDLKNGADSLQKVEGVEFRFSTEGITEIEIDPIKDIQTELTNHAIAQKEHENQIVSALRAGNLELVKDATDEETRIISEALDLQTQLRQEASQTIKDLAFESVNAIFENRVSVVDREIEEISRRNEAFENSLAFEQLTEEQKTAFQINNDKQLAELEDKKQRREKQAFLVQQGLAVAQIAIDLGRTIVAINLAAAALDAITAGIGGQIYRAANIPVAITTAAAQTGIVLAQTIPQLYIGTQNADEGLHYTDERGAELHTDRLGNIKDFGSSGGARMKYLESGDKIFTANQTKNMLNMPFSPERLPKTLDEIALIQVNTDEKAMEKAMSRAIKKSRFNVSANVNMPKKVRWK